MRNDQGRNKGGQFDTTTNTHRYFEDDRLENVMSFKVTSRELRQASIMFDQNRKLHNWQTQSDMLRDMHRRGFSEYFKDLQNPDPELVQTEMETRQMEKAKKASIRHLHHEQAIEFMADQIELLKRNNDFGSIRTLLKDFQENTRAMKDPVIRRRRQEEFERRGWSEIAKELRAKLPIDG